MIPFDPHDVVYDFGIYTIRIPFDSREEAQRHIDREKRVTYAIHSGSATRPATQAPSATKERP